jgi:hypothetical protein
MVEFALLSGLVAIVLLVGVQIALIGNAALSVSQLSYMGARYASVHPSAPSDQVIGYMQSVASPTITGGTSTTQPLTITISPCAAAPNTLGSPVTVTVQYSLASKIFLPNPFMGVITFPANVSATQTAFCEGGE